MVLIGLPVGVRQRGDVPWPRARGGGAGGWEAAELWAPRGGGGLPFGGLLGLTETLKKGNPIWNWGGGSGVKEI